MTHQLFGSRESQKCQEARILVIYTGGTIGMMRNDQNVLDTIPNELVRRIRQYPSMHDEEYANSCYRSTSLFPPLVLPNVQGFTKRIVYEVTEYSPLLDSSNITADEWTQIAKDIHKSYENFDGFVVLHGTDTLSYTASALSFMLENLGKTVIITGSQIPIFETRTDGKDNFTAALIIAGNYVIPEVCVLFGNKLMRGNRTIKFSSNSLDAFDSPNAAPLGRIGINIDIDYNSIFRCHNNATLKVNTNLDPNVGLLRIFPSMTTTHLHAFLAPPMKGVVLQTFGAGNVPSNRNDLLNEVREACERGVIIVNCTQCPNGSVSALYLTGKVLWDLGVIPGYDMTAEAALTKLSYVLAQDEWPLELKKLIMETNLRGELTSLAQPTFQFDNFFICILQSLNISSAKQLKELEDALFAALVNWAIMSGDKENIDALKRYGIEANSPKTDAYICNCGLNESRISGEQLCATAARGTVQQLNAFRLAGADLSQPDPSGRTALHVAALHGHEEVVKFLLKSLDHIHSTDMLGLTALDYARRAKRGNIVQLLYQRMYTSAKSTQTSDYDSSNSS